MDKTKPNQESLPAIVDDSLSEHFDRQSIHNAMRAAQGVASVAYGILKEAGLSHTQKWLYDKLNSDRVLKAVWVDGRGCYSDHEAPTKAPTPQEAQAIEMELIKKDSEFLDRQGAETVFGNDAEMMMSFADFASKSFQTTVNITYGIAVVSAKNLHLRAQYIDEHILLNNEIVTRKVIAEDGSVEEVEGPKYSEDDKLEWQKQYNDIMDKLCKFSNSATAAANAKIEAYKASQGGGKKNKSSRGGRNFN